MESTTKIKLPVPYKQPENVSKSLKKIDDKLKELKKTGTSKILNFAGSREVETMFYLYLFKKYKSNCFLHDNNLNRRFLGMSIFINPEYESKQKMETENQLTTLAEQFIICAKKDTKIIIIPVQLIFPGGGGHANVLIYRKNLNQIEHFEPHGRKFARNYDDINNKIIDRWMKYFVSEINIRLRILKKTEVKLIESSEVCPYMEGLQNLESTSEFIILANVEPAGYCAAWSMFFTELCLKNPDIPSSTLMNYIFNTLQSMSNIEKTNYLRSVIRGYAVFVNEKIEKYFSLFDKSGLTIKKIESFSPKEKRKFFDILKSLVELEMNLATNPLHVQESLEYIKAKLDEISKKIPNMVTMKQINYLFGVKSFYEKYKNFKVSNPTESTSSQIMKKKPATSIKIEPVEKEYLGMDLKVCPEGKEINPKTGRCVKSKTKKQKLEKVKVEKVKTPKQNVEIKLEPVEKVKVEPIIKSCPPGKEINPKTGRCVKSKTQKVKKVKTPKVKTPKVKTPKVKTPKQKAEIKLEPEPKLELQPVLEPVLQPEIKMTKSCPPGKEINPKTGRCVKTKTQKVKKAKVEPVIKSCPPGKEINPKTGRCVKTKTQKVRKIKMKL